MSNPVAEAIADWLDADEQAENRAADLVREHDAEVEALIRRRLRPYEPPGLRELIESTTYKPGWEFHLGLAREDGEVRGWELLIKSDTEDSQRPGGRIEVWHPFLVPPASYKRDVWAVWVRDRLALVEGAHELGEFLAYGGVREFAPHHSKGEDPYLVWHVSDWATANKNQRDD